MKSFPRHLLEEWSTLRWTDFSPDCDLARAFIAVPASKGVNRYHRGHTPLGWLWQEMWMHRVSTSVLEWVDFLLAHGADPNQSFSRKSRPCANALVVPNLKLAVLRCGDPAARQVLERHGVDMLAPLPPNASWEQRPSLTDVLGWKDLCLLERFAKHHLTPWASPGSLSQVISYWRATPAIAAQGVEVLLAQGVDWDAADAPHLWAMALHDPTGPWLAWGQLHQQRFPWALQKKDVVNHWVQLLADTLVHAPTPNVARVRQAMEESIDPEIRPSLAPHLPSLTDRLGREQWKGVLELVDWAIHWGMPSNSRDKQGVPWALWVLRQCTASAEGADCFSKGRDCAHLGWECLERLLRAGHKPFLKGNDSASTWGIGQARKLGPSVDAVLSQAWNNLSIHQRDWPDRYQRLRRSIAFERRFVRRLSKDTTVPESPVPRARSRL